MSKAIDWETEIMYRGRPLSDYRASIIEECARVAEVMAKGQWNAELKMALERTAAAIRKLKDKP